MNESLYSNNDQLAINVLFIPFAKRNLELARLLEYVNPIFELKRLERRVSLIDKQSKQIIAEM